VHDAVLRRPDVDALELILGRHLPLDELRGLPPDIAELLGDVRPDGLVDLDDLKLGLGDLSLGLGDRGDQLPTLAFEARRSSTARPGGSPTRPAFR